VRIARVLPVAYGVVERFLLYGDFDGDVYATGGDVEVHLEPQTLYDDVKIYPLAKLDRSASLQQIKKSIYDEEGRSVCGLCLSFSMLNCQSLSLYIWVWSLFEYQCVCMCGLVLAVSGLVCELFLVLSQSQHL